MIGSCCGSTGCGSLSLQVRREGTHVLWEPADTGPRETIRSTYCFPLVHYLQAIDAAAAERPGEGRGRKVGRAVSALLRDSADVTDDLPPCAPGVERVGAYPYDSDVVEAVVVVGDEQHHREIRPRSGEADAEFARRVFDEVTGAQQPPDR